MNSLHSSTSLGALVLVLTAGSAIAATTIATDTTTPLATSSAGDVTVTEDGTITLSNGTAITIDSSNGVTLDGGLDMSDATGANEAAGIVQAPGTASAITIGEDASILVQEDFVADDDDANGIADGAIASASNRYAIHALSGASGSITNNGVISVDGINSGGIVVGSNYTGNILNTGTITVIGDNSVGISTGNVDGDISVEGSVRVVGAGAQGLLVDGDVTGIVRVQGPVAQSSSYTNDDGSTVVLSRAALRTGAAAVEITGNVAGGIYVASPPVDSDDDNDDEDGDGVDDSDEGTGAILSYGNAPALLIGGVQDTVIGGVTGNVGTYSLAIDGTVSATAYYSNTDAYGVVVGGQGGNVTLAKGIGVSGSITASTYDQAATALLINEGSTVTSLYNSGSITATISSPGEGAATAIRDLSGSLSTIENTGYIAATGSSTDTLAAIDLMANTSDVTIRQYLNATDIATSAEYLEDNETDTDPTIYAMIDGDIRLGSGNDTIDAATGEIAGDTYFGAGNDTLTLSGNTIYVGDAYFGAGTGTASLSGTSSFSGKMDFGGENGTLTLSDSSVMSGTFANAANLSVTVNSGATLSASDTDSGTVGSLHVASGGALGVYVEEGQSSLLTATNATLEDGAKVTATVSDLGTAEGTYKVLTADTLDVQGVLDSSGTDLPFIYNGSIATDANSVYLTIGRKTAGELGLGRSQAAAWNAVYATSQNDSYLTASLLDVEDSDTLNSQIASMLPDYSGGVFHAVTQADRIVSRHLSDASSMFDISDVGAWLEPVYFRSSRDDGATAGYKASGWGLSAGVERHTALGYFGLSYAWVRSTVKDNGGSNDLNLSQHDVGAFWRTVSGPFMAWARLGGSRISVDSSRTYTGEIADTEVTYGADGKWAGWMVSGLAGASYNAQVSRRLNLRPKVELEQFWLKEDGYDETADSDALALTVASRTSKGTTVTPSLMAAYSLGAISPDWHPLTFQIEGGRRQVLAGSLGDTTAYFNGGDEYEASDSFTLTPDSIKSAWVGEVSILAGGYDFTWKISGRAEQSSESKDLSIRAGMSVAF